VDERHGWATIEPPHSANFGMSDLYRTSDERRPLEIARPPAVRRSRGVHHQEHRMGPAVAAGNGRLFVTTDAGRTWREKFLPAPPGTASAAANRGVAGVDRPEAWGGGHVGVDGPGRAVVVVATMDGGRNWTAGPLSISRPCHATVAGRSWPFRS
jgi:photosystem II stability/assembly factor-like uncharacterized protein